MMGVATSFFKRLGDNNLSIGLTRFADSNGHPLWRLQFTRHPCGDRPLADGDATVAALTDLKRFCDQALEAIETDGGRLPTVEPERAA